MSGNAVISSVCMPAREGRVAVRRATLADVDFLVALVAHHEVEPFIAAVGARSAEELNAEVEQSERKPKECGRFVVEVEGKAAGAMAFDVANRRSRIAYILGVMLLPEVRGRGYADTALRLLVKHLFNDLDYHRLQLEVYGFNDRGRRHFERVGFVQEGVRRKAYWRHGEWQDGILYGLVQEDLEEGSRNAPDRRSR